MSTLPDNVVAYTIPEFCQSHKLSEAFYFKLKSEGRGPLEMKVGRRRMISAEAAAAWRQAQETPHKETAS
jgi:hypothetical protein